MSSYKLMYWNARGRGEAIRMMFTLAGQEFEDYRFKEGEWAEIKGNADLFPLGQAPVLIVDGKALPQSKAISQYLARKFDLYGSNNEEQTQIDIVSETISDVGQKLIPIFMEKDETKKAALIAKFRDEDSKRYFAFINKLIKEAGGRFFVGGAETLADVTVYTTMDFVTQMVGETFFADNYPELAQFHKGITENSKLSNYIKSRP